MDLSSGLGSPVSHIMQASTFSRAAAAAGIHGDRRARGKDAPCVRGRHEGFISSLLCLTDYRKRCPECSRDGGCSVGRVLLAKFEEGELPVNIQLAVQKTVQPIAQEKKLNKKAKPTQKLKLKFKKKPSKKKYSGTFAQAAKYIQKAVGRLHGTPTVYAVMTMAERLGAPSIHHSAQRRSVEAAGFVVEVEDSIMRVVGKKKDIA